VAAVAGRETRDFDLRASIMAAVDLHAATFESHALAVEVDWPAGLTAHADPDQVAQC